MTTTIDPPEQQLAKRGDQSAPQTAVAKRSFQPLAPIESVGALKGLLEAQKESLAQMLPKHITPERLMKTLLVAVNRNPDILKCTQASILETINRSAELGLDLSGTLGEAYPVPFNNSVKDAGGNWIKLKQLSLIIGYRGYEKLAWQSGDVESIDAEVVRQNDHFVFKKGTEVLVEWSPALTGDSGEVIGAYACVKMKSGGKLARFLPVSEIEKIRNASQSKNSPAWASWWDEMARKCALKRTLKDAPLSTEKYVKAMEQDEADYNMADVLSVEANGARGTAALTDQLRNRNGGTNQPVTSAEGSDTDESQIGGDEDSHQSDASDADDSQVSPQEQWDIFVGEVRESSGIPSARFKEGLRKFLLSKGKVGKGYELDQAARAELVKAAKDQSGPFKEVAAGNP